LLRDLEDNNEERILERAGKPIAKVIQYKKSNGSRRFGCLKGQIKVIEDFDTWLDDMAISLVSKDGYMRLLLDTHVLIWCVEKNPQVTREIIDLITNNNIVFVSIATLWKMQIKSSLKKIEMPQNINMILEQNSYQLLNILPSPRIAIISLYNSLPFQVALCN